MSTDFLSRRMDLIHVENSGGSIILKMDTSYPVKLSGIVLKIFNATQDYYRHGEVEIDNADGDIIFTIPSGGQYANSSVYDFAGRVIRGNENFSDVSGEGKYYDTDSDVFKAGDYVITIIDFDNNKIYFCSESSFADFITSKDIPEYESDSMFRLYDREDEEELGNDAIELAKAFNEPTSERYSFIRNNSSEDLEVDEDIGDILYGNSTVSELIRNYDTGTEKEQVVPVAYVNTTYNNSLKQYVLPYSYFVKYIGNTTYDGIDFSTFSGDGTQYIHDTDSTQCLTGLKLYTCVDGYFNEDFKNKFAIEYDSDVFNALLGRFDRIEDTSDGFENIINNGWKCSDQYVSTLESEYGISISTASTDSSFETKKNNLISDYYFIYQNSSNISSTTFSGGIGYINAYAALVPIKKSNNYINYIQCEDFRINAKMNDVNGTSRYVQIPINLFPQNKDSDAEEGIVKSITPDDILGGWWGGHYLGPIYNGSKSGESKYHYDGNTFYEDDVVNFFSKYFTKSFDQCRTTTTGSRKRNDFEISTSVVNLNFLENFSQKNSNNYGIDPADFFPAIKQYVDHWLRIMFVDNIFNYYYTETLHLHKSNIDKNASITFEEGTDSYGATAEFTGTYFRPYLFALSTKDITNTGTNNNSSSLGEVLLNFGINFKYNSLPFDMLSSNYNNNTNNSNRLNFKLFITKQCYLSQLVIYNEEPCIQIYGDSGEVYYNIYINGVKQTDIESFLKLLHRRSIYHLETCANANSPTTVEGYGKISKIEAYLLPVDVNIDSDRQYSHSSTGNTDYSDRINAIIVYHGLSNYVTKYVNDSGELKDTYIGVIDGADDETSDFVSLIDSNYTRVKYSNGTISKTDSIKDFLLIPSSISIDEATVSDLISPIFRIKTGNGTSIVVAYDANGNEIENTSPYTYATDSNGDVSIVYDDDGNYVYNEDWEEWYIKIYKEDSLSLVPLSNYTKYVILGDGSIQEADDDETFFYVVSNNISNPDIIDILYPVFSESTANAHVRLYNSNGEEVSDGDYIKIYNNEFKISSYNLDAISPKVAWIGTDNYSGPFGFIESSTTSTDSSGDTTTINTYDITQGISLSSVTDAQLERNFYFEDQTFVNRTHDTIGNITNNSLIRYATSPAPYCKDYNNSIVKMYKNIPCYFLFDGNYFSNSYDRAYNNIKNMFSSADGYKIHYKYIIKESSYKTKIKEDTFGIEDGQTLDKSDFNSIYDFIKLSISHYINIDPDDPDSIRTSSPSQFIIADSEDLQNAINNYLAGNTTLAASATINNYPHTFSYSSKNPYQTNKFLITDKDGITYENTDNKIYEAEAQAGLNKIRVISLQDEDNIDLSLTGNEDTIEADTLNWNDLVNALSNNKSIDLLESLKYLKDPVADMEVGRNYHIQKSDSYNNYNVITSIAEEVNTLSKLEGYYKYSLFGSRHNDTDNATYYMLQNASKKYWVEELQEFYTIDYTNTTPSINKLIGNGNTSGTQAYSALKTNSTSATHANLTGIDDSSNNLFVTLSDSNGNLIEAGDYIIDGIPVKIVDRSNKYVCGGSGSTFNHYGWSTCIQFGMHTFKNNKVYIWLNPYNVGYTIPIPSGGGAITLPTNSSNSIMNRNTFITGHGVLNITYSETTGFISKMQNGVDTNEYKNYAINDILPIGLVTLSLRSLGYYDVFDYDYTSGDDISDNSNYLDSAQILQYYKMFNSNDTGFGNTQIDLYDDAPIGTFYQTIDDGIIKERDIVYTFNNDATLLLLDYLIPAYTYSTTGGIKLLKAVTVKSGTIAKLHFNSMGLLDDINVISDTGGVKDYGGWTTQKLNTQLYNSSTGNDAVIKSIMDALSYIIKDCANGVITTSNAEIFAELEETLSTMYTNYLQLE